MIWVCWASLFMTLGVAMGAFGAHALRDRLSAHQMAIYQTAVFYHFVHALGLFVVAWLQTLSADQKISWAGAMLVAGIFLFSGSLYWLSLTGIKWLGAVTPLGGASFIVAWVLIGLSAWHR